MNNTVRALAILGSDMYVVGDFTTAGGKVSAYLARAIISPPKAAAKARVLLIKIAAQNLGLPE